MDHFQVLHHVISSLLLDSVTPFMSSMDSTLCYLESAIFSLESQDYSTLVEEN